MNKTGSQTRSSVKLPTDTSSAALVFAGYVGVFVVLAAPLLPSFASAVPRGPNLQDAQLIVWILTWVGHALGTAGTDLFAANIAYPAAHQLTGTDHFLASQLLFAPAWICTGNPVLATNLAALSTYPLTALATERLARRLGALPATAWLGGLMAALGPIVVPFNVHVLQYPPLWFPVVALLLIELRESPSVSRAALLLLALLGGILTSSYMALILAVASAIWAASEFLRRLPQGGRFLILVAGSALVSASLGALLLQPYAARAAVEPGSAVPYQLSANDLWQRWAFVEAFATQRVGRVGALAVLLGAAVAFAARCRLAIRVSATAIALGVTSLVFAAGIPAPLEGLVAGTPLALLRSPTRFVVLTGFAVVLLFDVTLDAILRALPVRPRMVLAAAVGAWLCFSPGARFADIGMHPVAALARGTVYDQVAAIARRDGPGALLELPLFGKKSGSGERVFPLEPDSMIGSTRHWLPLIGSYNGYQAPHRGLLLETLAALPQESALQDLIDMTHVRWILIRPRAEWPRRSEHDTLVAALAASPSIGAVERVQGFTLLRIDRSPQRGAWFESLRDGAATGRTLLGTALGRIAEQSAIAHVSWVPHREQAIIGEPYVLVVTVSNEGARAWPAALRPARSMILDQRTPNPQTGADVVAFSIVWRNLGDGTTTGAALVPLRRDVVPGDALTQTIVVTPPATSGTYELEVGVEQQGGARFMAPGNERARSRVTVTERRAGHRTLSSSRPLPPVG